jgi:FMN hydrolase / 5-amino-6-(5-phospho-D-ribitylamino)uracil phosphatase
MLHITQIKAITLDLDDTLWPIWPTIERAEKRLLAWLQLHAPATADLMQSPHVRQELRALVHDQWPKLHHDLNAMRRESIRLGLKRAGEDPALAEPAFDVFFAARMDVTLFDDALPGLKWLAKRYPIVALSNGTADVYKIGIGEFFVASVNAQDVGVGKPDPRIFNAATQRLGLQPHQILHVGDDANLDVIGALNVGMQTAWVNRADHLWSQPQEPHATVTSMLELCDLLGALGTD